MDVSVKTYVLWKSTEMVHIALGIVLEKQWSPTTPTILSARLHCRGMTLQWPDTNPSSPTTTALAVE